MADEKRGLFAYTYSATVDIENKTSSVPINFSLSQNYPNPFNPSTIIKYSIPQNGFMTLTVYNVLGKEVTKLVSEIKQPGSYEAKFDGSDLASGIYFYRLQSGSFSETKKFILIK